MPTYDFNCRVCDQIFEMKVSLEDRDSTLCPKCDNIMTRQMSVPGIQFKGSGFYSTDNRKK